ncbi:hypothetical protein, partial [Pseudomonas sp. FEN]
VPPSPAQCRRPVDPGQRRQRQQFHRHHRFAGRRPQGHLRRLIRCHLVVARQQDRARRPGRRRQLRRQQWPDPQRKTGERLRHHPPPGTTVAGQRYGVGPGDPGNL